MAVKGLKITHPTEDGYRDKKRSQNRISVFPNLDYIKNCWEGKSQSQSQQIRETRATKGKKLNLSKLDFN